MPQVNPSFSQTNHFYQQALVLADQKQFYRSALCLKDAVFSAMNVYKERFHLSLNHQNLDILNPSQILLIQKLDTGKFKFENQLQFERFFEQCITMIETIINKYEMQIQSEIKDKYQIKNKIDFFKRSYVFFLFKTYKVFLISIFCLAVIFISAWIGFSQWYQANKIYQDTTLESQFFWSSKSDGKFSENKSYNVAIKSSHLPKDYGIQFPKTITANRIRFDPSKTPLDAVNIYSIQLFNSGQFIKEIPINQIEKWSFININSYSNQGDHLSLQFDSHDPYFITHQFDEISFNQIKIRLSSFNSYPFVLTFIHHILKSL